MKPPRLRLRLRWNGWSVGVLAVLVLLAANFVFTARYVHSTQAGQQRASVATEHKICTTLGRLAQLQPPPGDPRVNPARGYDQELHSTLDQLGPDLGCGS